MDKYYRHYYILKSTEDSQKKAVIKAERRDEFIKMNIGFDKRERKNDNLYLLGLTQDGRKVFKREAKEDVGIKVSVDDILRTDMILISYENGNTVSLKYIEKEKRDTVNIAFEKYRFERTTKNKKTKKESQTQQKRTRTNPPTHGANKKESKPQGGDMSDMLKSFQQASALFSKMNNTEAQKEGKRENQPEREKEEKAINPFRRTFPNSKWIKTEYQGKSGFWHYISGKIYSNGELKYKAIGVPGEYSISPPSWLEGFNKYYISEMPIAKGYWIMFLDPETGTVVDIGKKN